MSADCRLYGSCRLPPGPVWTPGLIWESADRCRIVLSCEFPRPSPPSLQSGDRAARACRRPVRGGRRRAAAEPGAAGRPVRGGGGVARRGRGAEHRGRPAARAAAGRRGRALNGTMIVMALRFETHAEISDTLRSRLVDIWTDA